MVSLGGTSRNPGSWGGLRLSPFSLEVIMPDVSDEGDTEIVGSYNANAGKEYTCDNCHKPIYKGERYVRVSTKRQGKFLCEHYHYTC